MRTFSKMQSFLPGRIRCIFEKSPVSTQVESGAFPKCTGFYICRIRCISILHRILPRQNPVFFSSCVKMHWILPRQNPVHFQTAHFAPTRISRITASWVWCPGTAKLSKIITQGVLHQLSFIPALKARADSVDVISDLKKFQRSKTHGVMYS